MIKSELQSIKGVYKSQFIRCWWRTLSKYSLRYSFWVKIGSKVWSWYFEIFMTFFFSLQSYLFILWKTRVLQVRVRSRQKFGTNRKKCSTNVKHRHVGINRRLFVQFNNNPRVQRLQNGHRNNSASGWRATTTLLNMRFLFLRHSLHVCTWFASALPALFAARVTKGNENVTKKWFYEHNNNSAPASLFSNFFVVHAQLRHHITKYD